MPHYYSSGKIPTKRHVQFRKPDGSLYSEQLISTEGFASLYSLTYHLYPPTRILKIDPSTDINPVAGISHNMQHRSFQGFKVLATGDYLDSRIPVLFNNDVCLYLAAPCHSTENYFFKNSDASELIFVHEGSGTLKTIFGNIHFEYGDQIIIPRGTIYQIAFETESNRLFIVESATAFRFPKRYINPMGQLLEHAPFCERDIKKPVFTEPVDQAGDFLVMIKKEGLLYPYHYASHPFDVVGWDGYDYPFALSIHNFEPITGRIHQPPPVHQTFEARGFVTCAFVPRLYDYHPDAIPAPYNHANIDSDEVLYYVDGNFMSRNHIEKGQITLHPIGIPHGPHPGAAERSIGQKETNELAVMVDTFSPLKITKQALELEDKDYYKSWL